MFLFLKNLLQLILSPGSGWEDISASNTPVDRLMRTGLYPFIVLASLSVFAQKYYVPTIGIPVLVIMCLVTFISFFFAYFVARVIFKNLIYKFCITEPSEKKYSTVILYTVSLLCLSMAIYYVMPVKVGLEYILPAVTALILWKSVNYLGVDVSREYSFIVFAILVVIVPPLIVQKFFLWVLS